MPVTVRKIGDKFRVVKVSTGRIATTPSGKPRDGGGHATRAKAQVQANFINSNEKGK